MAEAEINISKSTDPWWIATYTDHEKDCGYTVTRLKDLPKLHKAVWKDDLQRVKTVLIGLKKTMYIDYFDKDQRTALHFACARGHDGMVKSICLAGANPNIADGQGKTPLHKAVESRNYSSVQHLLNTRADPDVMDEFGRTPLHLAAKMGDIPAVQLLLERSARTDLVERDGLTALHVATLNNNHEIVNLISHFSQDTEQDSDSDLVIIDEEEDFEIVSSVNEGGRTCSTPVSQNRLKSANSSVSTKSSDFELIFDTDDDSNMMSRSYYPSDFESSSSSIEYSSESVTEVTTENKSQSNNITSDTSGEGWDTESVVNIKLRTLDKHQYASGRRRVLTIDQRQGMSIARLKEEEEIASDCRMANIVKEVLGESSEEDEFVGEDKNNAFKEVHSAYNSRCIEGVTVEIAEANDDDSSPDVIEDTDGEEANDAGGQPELTEEQLLLARQLKLLDSFRMLMEESLQVTKIHQTPLLKDRCPLYAHNDPIMFNFKDIAIYFVNEPNRAPIGENLFGVAGKVVALTWVDPSQIVQADPTDKNSFKALISKSPPLMQIIGLGVFMCMHWEEKRLFVTSRDVHQSSPLLARVNTLVLSAPDCPITHYAWPPYTQLNADTFEPPKPEVTPEKIRNSIACATQQMSSAPVQSTPYNIPPLMPPPSVQPTPYLSFTLPHSSHPMPPPPPSPFTATLCHPHNKPQQVYHQYQQIIQTQPGRQLQAPGQQQMLNQSQYSYHPNYLQMPGPPPSGLPPPPHLPNIPHHNNPSVIPRHSNPSVMPRHSNPSVMPRHSNPSVMPRHNNPSVMPRHSNPSVMTHYTRTTLQPVRRQTHTGLNQLLHLLQQQHNLPPILRPQEWFTSI